MIKKLFFPLLLLLPILVKAQNTQDQYFCISRTTVSAFTAANNTTYRGLLVNGTITVPDNAHDIHIVKCFVGNSTNARGAINIGHNTTNIVIDTCFITNAYYGVNCGGGNVQSTANGLKVNYNRFYNITDAPGHPHGGGCAVQLNMINGTGIQINYNDCYFPGLGPDVGDVLSIYKSNGTAGSLIQVNYNCGVGGSSDPTGKCFIVLGDVGGSYQQAIGNKAKTTGYLGVQVQGGTNINMSYNQNFSTKNSTSLLGMSYGNYSGVPSSNITMGHNQNTWTNRYGNIDNGNYKSGLTKPTDWDTNTPEFVADPNVNSSILPDVLFNPTCTIPPVTAPSLSYNGSPFTFTAGTTIAQLNINNSGGAVAGAYNITPALPSGLTLNTTTGTIQGTPTIASSATTYTVSGSNSAGTGHAVISIKVNAPPIALPAFTYKPSTNVYSAGTAITPLSPISTGGAITSYSIAAPSTGLPTGLSIDATSGIISGTPSAVLAPTVFTILGTNSSGQGKTTITLSVTGNPIVVPNISYTPSTLNIPYGTPINWTATNTGSAATFSISPALPFGLGLVAATGLITGSPAGVQGATNYTVTATNATGSGHCTITLSVTKANLTITGINQQKYQGQANPALTYGISGLVNNDSPNQALQTPPTLSTTAITGSPVGSYPIVPSAAVSANYNLLYTNGILQVLTPTTLIIFSKFGGIQP